MSRAKISVYMKNLAHFDIVEKVVSFETGGWENAKKGVYQIKNTFVNFWFKFIYSHQSQLYTLSSEDFYDTYIALELENYLNRYFRNVCMEYLSLLNQMGRLPVKVNKMGTWKKRSHRYCGSKYCKREDCCSVQLGKSSPYGRYGTGNVPCYETGENSGGTLLSFLSKSICASSGSSGKRGQTF